MKSPNISTDLDGYPQVKTKDLYMVNPSYWIVFFFTVISFLIDFINDLVLTIFVKIIFDFLFDKRGFCIKEADGYT